MESSDTVDSDVDDSDTEAHLRERQTTLHTQLCASFENSFPERAKIELLEQLILQVTGVKRKVIREKLDTAQQEYADIARLRRVVAKPMGTEFHAIGDLLGRMATKNSRHPKRQK